MLRKMVLALALLGGAPAMAQLAVVSEAPYSPVDTRQFVLRSEKLGHDVLVVVTAPPAGVVGVGGERSPDVRLPVIFALDNGWGVAGPTGQFMSQVNGMSAAYVVSIGYPGVDHRWADFSFTAETGQNLKLGDGGERFLTFLTHELRPFLAARYAMDTSRSVLFGHSLGGLFAANVLAREPDAFAAYVIGSPSTIADPGLEARLAAALPTIRDKRVFVAAAGEEDAPTIARARTIGAALSGPRSRIAVETRIYDGESHISYYARLTPEAFSFILPPPVKRASDAVVLTSNVMDRIVGSYRIADGRILAVKREGSILMVQLTGIPGQTELKPESASRFFIPNYDSKLDFTLPDAGPASDVTIKVNGVEMHAVRQ